MKTPSLIQTPTDSSLNDLCDQLRELSNLLDQPGAWVGEQLQRCAEYGVFKWFAPSKWGGLGWNTDQITQGYLKLSQACLTTTFVITQRTGACRRIISSQNERLIESLIGPLVDGSSFATVGISHLTTSRQHLARPVMSATRREHGFVFDGMSPWVTGSPFADFVVVGGTTPENEQVLAVISTDLENITTPVAPQLVGLTASQTGQVVCNNVFVEDEWVIAGPNPNVMQSASGARTGGHQTSTLALGLAKSAIDFVLEQANKRDELMTIGWELNLQWEQLEKDLMSLARGEEGCSNDELRASANSLVLRSTQASMSAAKGAGYLASHPAGRWCREALFFLVWSCPRSVVDANLCELAGIVE